MADIEKLNAEQYKRKPYCFMCTNPAEVNYVVGSIEYCLHYVETIAWYTAEWRPTFNCIRCPLAWVAPRDAPTSSQSLIRSVSEQSWHGLAVRDFGGSKGKGVVATCPMDKGDVVCDYHGTLISDAE
ncbi:hypothetical protein CgunFtcFv8_026271 [Champsocephalus gunnari]|uniref:Uncharacterized protein n=1 Tax=Champsocephalus gunnari TaxID=52237 RepID=A0AAN8CH77_CHAGU|nr:hypothetical protein CgunFtcFv8_026271 [Champsocephalus gunnari]